MSNLQNPARVGWWFVAALALEFACCSSWSAQVPVEMDGLNPNSPDNVEIYVGDAVLWEALLPALTESYTGEWKSPNLNSGGSFSYTFNEPGTYIYRTTYVGTQVGYVPGVVRVRKIDGGRPAVSIVSPLDGNFSVASTHIIAVATNDPAMIQMVNFYANGQFVGAATNSPYTVWTNLLGSYILQAAAVDRGGHTNMSPSVRVTFLSAYDFHLFNPIRLPGGQFACFFSAGYMPTCLISSDDLKTWSRGPLYGQWLGQSVLVDETATNAVRRFYKLKDCL